MKNNAFLAVFNIRLLLVCLLTVAIFIGSRHFQITFKNDYNIFSIAIVFPLVFSLTAAFRKRQLALQHFSAVRSHLVCIYDYFSSSNQLSQEIMQQIKHELVQIPNLLIGCMSKSNDKELINQLRKQLDVISTITAQQKEKLNEREVAYIIRSKKDLNQNIDTLYSLKHHHSPKSLRAYCLVFIYLFPFIYVPGIVQNTIDKAPLMVGFFLFLSLLIGFVLMALYNIQELIEDPFDNEGLDDVKLDLYLLSDQDLHDTDFKPHN